MGSLFSDEQIFRAFGKKKIEQGREEGEKKNAVETARRMLQKEMPTNLISELTSLPVSEIEELRNSQ